MPTPNRRTGRRKRRLDDMNFAYSGPFAPLLDSRVGRALPLTKERYTPDSPESYRIGDYAPVALLVDLAKRPKRRRRRGGRRVAA